MEDPADSSKPVFTRCPHGLVKQLVVCRRCVENPPPKDFWYVPVVPRRKTKGPAQAFLPCPHYAQRRMCKFCLGSMICTHGVNKHFCKHCDGRRLCQVCKSKTMARCYEVCKGCRQSREDWEAVRDAAKKSKQRMALCI